MIVEKLKRGEKESIHQWQGTKNIVTGEKEFLNDIGNRGVSNRRTLVLIIATKAA